MLSESIVLCLAAPCVPPPCRVLHSIMPKAAEGPTQPKPLPGWLMAAELQPGLCPQQGYRGQVRQMWCRGMGLHGVGAQQITLLLLALGITSFQDTTLWFNFVSGKERGNLSCECRDMTRSNFLCCV